MAMRLSTPLQELQADRDFVLSAGSLLAAAVAAAARAAFCGFGSGASWC